MCICTHVVKAKQSKAAVWLSIIGDDTVCLYIRSYIVG